MDAASRTQNGHDDALMAELTNYILWVAIHSLSRIIMFTPKTNAMLHSQRPAEMLS